MDALQNGHELWIGELQALDRLIEIAKGFTTQAKQTALFLLPWWNPAQRGFAFRNLWSVAPEVEQDMVTVFGLIMRLRIPPETLGYGNDFMQIARAWPQLAKYQVEQERDTTH